MIIFSARRGYCFVLLLIINLLVASFPGAAFSAEIPAQSISLPNRTPHPSMMQAPASGSGQAGQVERPVRSRSDFSYENSTLTEDVTWKGIVIIRGYLLVAPQATLRIEQGTEIRFMKSLIVSQQPRLIVMGRIQCNGTSDRPVLFSPNVREAAWNDWGGILLLASEKRNLLEFCRIEGATTAIEASFSTLAARGVTVLNSVNGIKLKDSTATLSLLDVAFADTGLRANDSEIDLQEGSMMNNQVGVAVFHSGLSMASMKMQRNRQGFVAEESRIRVSGCEFSSNEVGAEIVKGEGQLLLSVFSGNHEVGLRLQGARIKVQRSLFADNPGDALQADTGQSIIWGSTFTGNKGNNLVNLGAEPITAVLNWWGSNEESAVIGKAGSRKPGTGTVVVWPWLDRKPSGVP